MALTYSPAVNRDTDETGAEPRDFRVALEGMLVREGLLPGSPATLVQGTAGWAYQINGPAWWATRHATGDGLHVWGNDGAITVGESTSGEDAQGGTVPPAPASGLERIDVVWVMQASRGEGGATSSVPRAGVAVGDPGAVAIAPSIPTGATEIARNTMTSAATSTSSSGNTLTQTMPWTATKGGAVHCRTSGELDAVKALGSAANPILAELDGVLYLCRDGSTAERQTPRQMRAGSVSGTTSGAGGIAVTFSSAMPSTSYSVQVTDTNTSAGIGLIHWKVDAASKTTTGFTARAFPGTGTTPITGLATTFDYVAVENV